VQTDSAQSWYQVTECSDPRHGHVALCDADVGPGDVTIPRQRRLSRHV
jgi:hypothetical protein